jgi:hypothetical protein
MQLCLYVDPHQEVNSIKPGRVLQAIFLTPKGQYCITTMPIINYRYDTYEQAKKYIKDQEHRDHGPH